MCRSSGSDNAEIPLLAGEGRERTDAYVYQPKDNMIVQLARVLRVSYSTAKAVFEDLDRLQTFDWDYGYVRLTRLSSISK